MTCLLEARGLTRRFGGVVALDNLDLAVVPNEIMGLIGPNGSGKTTFFNVVTGIYGAHGGSAPFDGTDITPAPRGAVMRHGKTKEIMGRISQVREPNPRPPIVNGGDEMGLIERITDRCVVLNF